MIRYLVAALFVMHGVIHLLGFFKAFDLAGVSQLGQPIPSFAGVLWLAATLFCCIAAAALFVWPRWWWAVGAGGILISQTVIFTSWADAGVGTMVNVVLLVAILHGFVARGPAESASLLGRRGHGHHPAARPNIVLLDLRLSDGNGVELCRELRSLIRDLDCLMPTSLTDQQAMMGAILAGAGSLRRKTVKNYVFGLLAEVGDGPAHPGGRPGHGAAGQ